METGRKTGEKEGMEHEDGVTYRLEGKKERRRWWKG